MIKISEINHLADFMSLEIEWNELVQRTNDVVNLRHEFFRILIESFAKESRLRILVARDDGKLVGILPLVQAKGAFCGLPVIKLSSISNPHFTRFDMISSPESNCAEAFLRYLSDDKAWSILNLEFAPVDGLAWGIHDVAVKMGFKAARHELMQSPYASLPDTFAAMQDQLSSRFKSNLKRQRRQLADLGLISIEKFISKTGLEDKLKIGFALEQSGWKGEKGTAIASQKELLHFFSELAQEGSARGYLVLYFLTVSGKPIAFQYGLNYNGRYLLLKPGYDETYSRFGPGQLLVEDVVRDCIAQGIKEFDLLGVSTPWKLYWTNHIRPHGQLFVFQKTFYAMFLWALRFKWGALIKKNIPWRR